MKKTTIFLACIFLISAAFAIAATGKIDQTGDKNDHELQYGKDKINLQSKAIVAAEHTNLQNSVENISATRTSKEDKYIYGTAWIPNKQLRVHKVGNLYMSVTNYGAFGSQMNGVIDSETGLPAPSCEFPAGSGNEYLYQGGLWVGAVTGDDTLVSVGIDGWQFVYEMFPDSVPGGAIIKRSNLTGSPDYSPDAISEEDYIAIYYDTITNPAFVYSDLFDARPHMPLGLKIRQESYAWSSSEYEDFIIFRYIISNIAQNQLEDVYVGLFYDADIHNPSAIPDGYSDDVSGSIQYYDDSAGEDVLIGWAADNDGDPVTGSWSSYSPRGVLGVSLLKFPNTSEAAFNWWISDGNDPSNNDWGPMLEENYRDFGTGGIGTPEGDKNKYYIMSNGEHDYDQMFTGIDHTGDGWLPQPSSSFIQNIADGYDTRFLFSFGGASLNPGDSIELAFVVTVGDGFHKNPDDYENLFDINNPQLYYDSLDFSNLIENVQTARELYDSLFPVTYICGDVTGDQIINANDVVFIINYMFLSGPSPYPPGSGDANCDDKINLIDVIYIVNYIFRGGYLPGDLDGDGIPDC